MSGPGLLLAIESATARASVALLRGDDALAERAGEGERHHSETLLPLIDEVLRESDVALGDVAACAVSIGPGAFTSLRIGVATVKGLCFGSDRPVAPVPTLEALAEAGRRAGAVGPGDVAVPVLDARRGEVYVAAHRIAEAGEGEAACVLPPCVLDADGLAAALPGGGCLIGEGAAIVGEGLERSAPGRFDVRAGAGVLPEAVALGRIGSRLLGTGDAVAAARLVPRYVRRAEAEVQRTAQRFE